MFWPKCTLYWVGLGVLSHKPLGRALISVGLSVIRSKLDLVSWVVCWTWCSPYFGLSVICIWLVFVGFPMINTWREICFIPFRRWRIYSRQRREVACTWCPPATPCTWSICTGAIIHLWRVCMWRMVRMYMTWVWQRRRRPEINIFSRTGFKLYQLSWLWGLDYKIDNKF